MIAVFRHAIGKVQASKKENFSFSGKHKQYGVKREIAHIPNGIILWCMLFYIIVLFNIKLFIIFIIFNKNFLLWQFFDIFYII